MSTILIATDEAGYGPKLGPLVIAGTVWKIPSESIVAETLDDLFAPLRRPCQSRSGLIVVDDSKVVFKPPQGLDALHAVVSAAMDWSGNQAQTLVDWLPKIAAKDLDSILHTVWFKQLGEQRFLDSGETDPLLMQWSGSGLQLLEIGSRIISARHFNARCAVGFNKADLLSESTIGLVRSLVDSSRTNPAKVLVFCDRHGGRRYYSSVLQHCFPDWQLRVIDESKRCSRYQLTVSEQTIDFSFTVKGDSFTPVALSSMIAKYLRERLMGSLNEYFSQRHQGADPLKPTAGYPVDADRYLSDIQPIIESEQIAIDHLVRSR